MAAITLRSQATGVRPGFGYADKLEHATLRSGSDTFNVRARALNDYGVRSFEIVHEEMNDGQSFLLNRAWSDARGGTLPMNFTPPRELDAAAIEVSFVGDELVVKNVEPGTWSARYTIEEVL